MRKSRFVKLSLVHVISAAALAAGCGDSGATHMQTCVDNNKTIVATERCDEEQRQNHGAGYVPFYHWYYYPRSYGQPMIGNRAPESGTFSRPSTSVARPNVVRGGFGSTAHGAGTAS